MASQRFCLRWNNHQSNMLSVFDQLLHAETFTDVTLAVDGQLLKAHKMVLSACSPYFQALFVNHQEKHPIVILKDVPYSDMKSLLDFMYRGEVSVDQERLTAFLKVAESLRIKGLTEVNEEKCDIPALTNSLIQQQTNVPVPPPQLHRIHPYMNQKRPASGMPTGGAPPNLLMPLLGNALMQPKRKRGRPRKLSGSSSDALNTAASPPGEFTPESAAHASSKPTDQLVRGSPEMVEVKMSVDGFNADDGGTSGGEDGGEALLIDEGEDMQCNDGNNKDIDVSADCILKDVDPIAPMITMEMMEEDTVVVLNEDGTEVTDQPNSPLVPLKTNNEIKITEINLEEHELEAIIDTKSPELLEYVERADSSVACKLCGEVFESKLCWYRHKYQSHIIYPANSTMVFQCEHCLVYFKTKTGYLTHIATHHSSPSGEGDHLQQFNKIPPEKVEPKVTIQDLISRTNPDLVITKTNGLTCSPGCKLNAPSVPTEKVVIENSNRLMLPIRPEQAKQIIKPAETRKDHNAYTYKKPADVRPIIEATQFQIIKTTDFSIVPVPKTANCKPVDLPRKDQAVQINKPSNQRIKEQLQQIVRPTIHAEKNIKEQNQDFRPATLRNSRDPRPPELHPKDPTLQIFRPADLCTVVDQNPHSKEKIGHVTISNEQIIRKESCTNTSVLVSNNELTVKSNGLPRIEINQQQFIRAVEPRPRVEVRVKPMPDQRIKSTNAYLSRSKESKKEIIVKDEAEKKKDELFVTEIIQRVRRECEEKGIGDQPARRHSYRRTTVT